MIFMLFFGDELFFSEHPLEVFCKKAFLKNFANFTEKHLCWSLSLIKLQASGVFLTPTQVFSYEICKIFKNICFEEHLRVIVSTFLHFIESEWLLNEIILSFSVCHSKLFRLILIFFCFFLAYRIRGHKFMTFTRNGGGGVLKFVTCLQILLFLNNRSIVHFCWFVDVISGWLLRLEVQNAMLCCAFLYFERNCLFFLFFPCISNLTFWKRDIIHYFKHACEVKNILIGKKHFPYHFLL